MYIVRLLQKIHVCTIVTQYVWKVFIFKGILYYGIKSLVPHKSCFIATSSQRLTKSNNFYKLCFVHRFWKEIKTISDVTLMQYRAKALSIDCVKILKYCYINKIIKRSLLQQQQSIDCDKTKSLDSYCSFSHKSSWALDLKDGHNMWLRLQVIA